MSSKHPTTSEMAKRLKLFQQDDSATRVIRELRETLLLDYNTPGGVAGELHDKFTAALAIADKYLHSKSTKPKKPKPHHAH